MSMPAPARAPRPSHVCEGYVRSDGDLTVYCDGCTSLFVHGFRDKAQKEAFVAGEPISQCPSCPFRDRGHPSDLCGHRTVRYAGPANPVMEQWQDGKQADWPREPADFLLPAADITAQIAPAEGEDFWRYRTSKNRFAPDRVWIATGPKILELPETRSMEVHLAGYDNQLYGALHVESRAIVLFRLDEFRPEIALRIASREFWETHYGYGWWQRAKLFSIACAIMEQTVNVGILWPRIAGSRSAWHIDKAMERMSTFVPEPLDCAPNQGTELKLFGYDEFIEAVFQQPIHLLSPWLTLPGLAMIFAERGVGKTMFTSSVAIAVSTGNSFLGWSAGRPRRVLIIDGEMPAADLQRRYVRLAAGMNCQPAPENLVFLAADWTPDGLPDLGTEEGQKELEPYLHGFDLIIVDNLSTLVRSGAENEADSWGIVQAWAIRQRSAGRSVLLVHHAGKNGGQRGTSRREDVLGTVIQLKRPAGYAAVEGAKFEIHFTKSRGFYGVSAEPVEAQLQDDGTWLFSSVNQAQTALAVELFKEGQTMRDIASKLGISTSTVSTWVKDAGLQPKRGRRPKSPEDGD